MKKILFISLLIAINCSCCKDAPVLPNNCLVDFSDLCIGEDSKLVIKIEAETASFLSTLNSEDKELMTESEKVLSIPKPKRFRAIYIVKENGLVDADVIFLTDVTGMPVFPENMVGLHQFPKRFRTSRIEMRDGIYSHYNADNEFISRSYMDFSLIRMISSLTEEIVEHKNVSEEQFNLVLDAYEENGFEIEKDLNSINGMLSHTFPDNSKVSIIIDKENQIVKGKVNYDNTGIAKSSSNLMFSENNEEVIGYNRSTYFDSPFTENRMVMNNFIQIISQEIINPQI